MKLAGLTAGAVWANPTRTLTSGGGGGTNPGAFSVLTGLFALTTAAGAGTFGSYVQVSAALAHSVNQLSMSAQDVSVANNYKIAFATGAIGSEVDQFVLTFENPFATVPTFANMLLDVSVLPKGARVAVRAALLTAGTADNINAAINLGLTND